jgi:hypothetical protein
MVTPVRHPRQTSVAQQRARTAELDRLRLQRPLTPQEQAEADSLSNRAYLRAWRATQRERENTYRRTSVRSQAQGRAA